MKHYTCIVDLTNTDWKLLRKQKTALIKSNINTDVIDGLLSFVDHIQDAAADQIGEKEVFGK